MTGQTGIQQRNKCALLFTFSLLPIRRAKLCGLLQEPNPVEADASCSALMCAAPASVTVRNIRQDEMKAAGSPHLLAL